MVEVTYVSFSKYIVFPTLLESSSSSQSYDRYLVAFANFCAKYLAQPNLIYYHRPPNGIKSQVSFYLQAPPRKQSNHSNEKVLSNVSLLARDEHF